MNELVVNKYTVVVEDLIFEEELGNYFWKPERVEVDPNEHITINETEVDIELMKMGQVLSYYGDLSAKLKAQLYRKEEDLEAVEADVDANIRGEALIMQRTDPKKKPITETQIKKGIVRSEKYQQSLAILSASRLYSLRMDNLFKAFMKKSDALNTLSHNQRAERKSY